MLPTTESAPNEGRIGIPSNTCSITIALLPVLHEYLLDGPTRFTCRVALMTSQRLLGAHTRAGQGSAPAQRCLLSHGPRADDHLELEATLVPDSFHCK
jgi:hypothetical protein